MKGEGRSAYAGKSQSIALEIAERLRHPLWRQTVPIYDASLARGDAGLAVLYGYLDRCFPGAGWDKAAHDCVVRIGQGIDSLVLPSGLFGGLAGLGFATWYLSHDEKRYRRARSAIDDALIPRALEQAQSVARAFGMPVEDYDVISGLSGIGAYLLCPRKDDRAQSALSVVLQALVEMIERGDEKPAWFTPPELITAKSQIGLYPEGNLNCGLAHGIPGPLSVLALAYQQGISVPHQAAAIARMSSWLRNQRVPDRWGGSWPAAVPVGEGPAIVGPTTAWCYGSLGVARALWLAGTALHDGSLCETAVDALKAVLRRPASARGVVCSTFCHGTAGLLHIVRRFAADTGLADLYEAAEGLLEPLLASFMPETAFGYRGYDPGDKLVDRPGLLDGAAGVALVMLAVDSGQDPTWERVFLLS